MLLFKVICFNNLFNNLFNLFLLFIIVVSNRSFGWAYGGMPYFKPYEIFQQDTTNAVMAGVSIINIFIFMFL
jgi:hypothetical protein